MNENEAVSLPPGQADCAARAGWPGPIERVLADRVYGWQCEQSSSL